MYGGEPIVVFGSPLFCLSNIYGIPLPTKKKSHRPTGTMRIFSLFYSILVCFLCIFVVIMNTKEKIHYITACLMLLFGCTLCVAGFAVKPVGIVDESVLLILGQCVIYAGSVFGISLYVKSEIKKKIGK